ncbi:MAG: hypothetical protein U9N86_01280 [Bacteroidota bacterium]|nr:hypothetical protein [Bacteroidota bacterium]
MEDIYDKLRKIEALLQRTSSEGERHAAERARDRLQERISDEPLEYTVRSRSSWQKKLFVAVCNKYGYKTYRYHRQKHTTTMVRISKSTMETIIWPEHEQYSALLNKMVTEITDDLIDKIHHGDHEEAVIVGELTASP